MKQIILALSAFILTLSAFSQDKPEGLFINSKAPDIKAVDQNGTEINTKDLRKKGNIVIVFYRGYWCPYCSRYVKKLQDSLQLIKEAGADVLIVTPETSSFIDSTVARTGATMSIITDKDMKIAKAYKVAFKVDDKAVVRYKNANPPIDLLKINDQSKEVFLPIPAVYIVNTDGAVTYRFFEEDYKKRTPVSEIIKSLKGEK